MNLIMMIWGDALDDLGNSWNWEIPGIISCKVHPTCHDTPLFYPKGVYIPNTPTYPTLLLVSMSTFTNGYTFKEILFLGALMEIFKRGLELLNEIALSGGLELVFTPTLVG